MNNRRIREPNRAPRSFPGRLCLILAILLLVEPGHVLTARDIVLEGVYEAALDLPRIHFLLQRPVPRTVLGSASGFAVHDAFLDTGASGVLLSRETAQGIGRDLDIGSTLRGHGGWVAPNASQCRSRCTWVCLAISCLRPAIRKPIEVSGGDVFQVKQTGGLLGEAINVIGMPALYKGVVVLNTGATNDLGFCGATLKEPGDPSIPSPHVTIKLRFVDFANRRHPDNAPPLPVIAPNPVMDGLVLQHRGHQSKGSWLLDTGGTISLISTRQARQLGITEDQTPGLHATGRRCG